MMLKPNSRNTKGKQKEVALFCEVTSSWADMGQKYGTALLRLAPQRICTLLSYIDYCKGTKAAISQEFSVMEVWDSSLALYPSHDDADEDWQTLGDRTLQKPVEEPAWESDMLTECQTLCVQTDGVYWTFLWKNASGPIMETGVLQRSDLLRMLASMADSDGLRWDYVNEAKCVSLFNREED